ncbi:MAG: AAA domain-containing protein [Acidimicrobiaceae bacterium]|nr:AAA domain-containing protein [Acidimicrobiaceae bacterium]
MQNSRYAAVAEAAEEWQKSLTDPSGRNQLLYYRDLKVGTLDISDASSAAIQKLKAGRKTTIANLYPDNDMASEARRRARTIAGKARSNFEERGVKTLYLVVGMATWDNPSTVGTRTKPAAPVLMCPLEMTVTRKTQRTVLQITEDWVLNATLSHDISTKFDIEINRETLTSEDELTGSLTEEMKQDIFQEIRSHAAPIPGFGITDRIVIGNFTYRKLTMVEEIRRNIDKLAGHDIVAALAGNVEAAETVRKQSGTFAVTHSLPDNIRISDEFLVLDADSSQHAAMNLALSGKSFVLQGPPGTGKSQTIANLIASMMAENKRVLFVAEKRAAIDAVMKRLKRVDLDCFVMDYHGGRSRRDVVKEIGDALNEISEASPENHIIDQNRHESVRNELSEYARALHEKHSPWELSYYDTINKLTELSRPARRKNKKTTAEVVLQFSDGDLEKYDPAYVDHVCDRLQQWVDLNRGILSGQSPWAGSPITEQAEVDEVQKLLRELLQNHVPALRKSLTRLCGTLEIADPEMSVTLEDCRELIENAEILAEIFDTLPKELFEVDYDRLSRWSEALVPARTGKLRRFKAAIGDKNYRQAKNEIKEQFQNSRLKVTVFAELLSKLLEVRELLGCTSKQVSEQTRSNLAVDLEDFKDVYDTLTDTYARITQLTPQASWETLSQFDKKIRQLLDDDTTLSQLPFIADIENELRHGELQKIFSVVETGTIEPDAAVATFKRDLYNALNRTIKSRERILITCVSDRHHRLINEFKEYDRRHVGIGARRIKRRVAEFAVIAMNDEPEQQSILRKETNKKARHRPLRILMREAGHVISALKPCWTISPLDVAHVLPVETDLFDLVVFDEASQILPCDAIGSLLRAPQAMIVGDSRQLPPTTFFDATAEDEGREDQYEDSISDYESILDVMDALITRRMLTWHYRSEDERLIAFSNRHFYEGSLTTFPGAISGECLEHHLVTDRRPAQKGSSPGEVTKVVELMLAHARNRPEETLGVITMGLQHARRIEAELDQQLRQLSDELVDFFEDSNEERTFVKSIESVQGDERDAIILSVGYGWDHNGRLPHRFGPINQQGGERRLNVAVTRARKRMTVVSSFSHIDIDTSRAKGEGVQRLRDYLQYAESGGRQLSRASTRPELNAFELDIFDKLREAGLQVEAQYGASGYRIDFAIRHPDIPNRFALAVEADGASYHSTPTSRDRDRLRQENLERLGWRFCRIWSTDWFNDHQAEVDRVCEELRRAVNTADNSLPQSHTAVSLHATPEYSTSETTLNQRVHKPSFLFEMRGQPITAYTTEQLVALARWVVSDGRLRTNAQIFEEMFAELGYKKRGSRIRQRLNEAIDIM